MQHEQCELCTLTEDLEAQINEIRQVLSVRVGEYSKLERLEKMLGLTVALGFELFIEEGAFRDGFERKGFELEREFGELRERVGIVIEEYDGEMEKLQVGKRVGGE